jgi:hypothetical protein
VAQGVREGSIEDAGAGSFDCQFAPVVLTGRSRVSPGAGKIGGGRMEIVLISGRRIVVDASVGAAALHRILDVLERQ